MDEENNPPPRLDPWSIVRRTYASVFGDFGWFLRTTWAWAAVIVVVGYLRLFIGTCGYQPASYLLYYLFAAMGTASLGVLWCRRVVFGERPSPRVYLRMRRREWRYLLFVAILTYVLVGGFSMALLYLMVVLLFGDLTSAPFYPTMLISLCTMVLAWMLGARVFLIQTAQAVDDRRFFLRQSWHATRGNAWRIWLALITVLIPSCLATWISYDGINRLGTLDVPYLWLALQPLRWMHVFIAFGGGVLAAVAIAHVYVQLVGTPEAREESHNRGMTVPD